MPIHDFDNSIVTANSILTVKASENTDSSASNDLNLPEGKSISELLYEEENKNTDQSQESKEAGN